MYISVIYGLYFHFKFQIFSFYLCFVAQRFPHVPHSNSLTLSSGAKCLFLCNLRLREFLNTLSQHSHCEYTRKVQARGRRESVCVCVCSSKYQQK